jgi:hypothetical protein
MAPATMTAPPAPADYPAWLADLKTRIRETPLRAAFSVNSELIGLYRAPAATSWGGWSKRLGTAGSSTGSSTALRPDSATHTASR